MAIARILASCDDLVNGVRGACIATNLAPLSQSSPWLLGVSFNGGPGGRIVYCECDYGCGCNWLIEGARVWLECPSHRTLPLAVHDFANSSGPFPAPPNRPLSLSNAAPPELELSFDTEPIVGWRAWRLVNFTRHGGIMERWLAPLTGRSRWEPRRRFEARCEPDPGGSGGNHEAPWRDCMCGVWALREYADLFALSATAVVGEVYLWGRVLEFKQGWRARYAYPKSLLVLDGGQPVASELERLYGVPVTVEQRTPIAEPEGHIDRPLTNISAAYLQQYTPDALKKAMDRLAAAMLKPKP